jgi:hypothetical protein
MCAIHSQEGVYCQWKDECNIVKYYEIGVKSMVSRLVNVEMNANTPTIAKGNDHSEMIIYSIK